MDYFTPEELRTFSDEALIMYGLWLNTPAVSAVPDRASILRDELERRIEAMPRHSVKVVESALARYNKLPMEFRLTDEEVSHVKHRKLIEAIKSLRGRTGLMLKEAKDIVDLFREAFGH